MSDPINPPHYRGDRLAALIEDFELNFNTGNAAKYLFRAGGKGDRLEDLKKAQWYLARELNRLEKLNGNSTSG